MFENIQENKTTYLLSSQVDDLQASYTLPSPQKCLAYEFQVRCACQATLTSNWSAICRTRGIETSES